MLHRLCVCEGAARGRCETGTGREGKTVKAVREESKAASVLKNRARGESGAGFSYAEEVPIRALLEGTGFRWG